jgi:kynurenine formamidase
VRAAVELVGDGRVFDLGTELAYDMPNGPRENFLPFRLSQHRTPQCLVLPNDPPAFDFSMDVVCGSTHIGTHIDAVVHVQAEGRMFGGKRAQDVYGDFGWREGGAETIRPIVARGVLLDVARSHGVDVLPDGFEIEPHHLEDCLGASSVELRSGDVVLVRTGKLAADYAADGSRYYAASPGVGVEAAVWLYEQGMVLLGTDTAAIEPLPFPDAANTVHRALLVDRGVHLIEILDLEELAATGPTSFLFVCLPLKVRGGTGSWVRPIAIT